MDGAVTSVRAAVRGRPARPHVEDRRIVSIGRTWRVDAVDGSRPAYRGGTAIDGGQACRGRAAVLGGPARRGQVAVRGGLTQDRTGTVTGGTIA